MFGSLLNEVGTFYNQTIESIENTTQIFIQDMFDNSGVDIDIVRVDFVGFRRSVLLRMDEIMHIRALQESTISSQNLKFELEGWNPSNLNFASAMRQSFRSDKGRNLYLTLLQSNVDENIASFLFYDEDEIVITEDNPSEVPTGGSTVGVKESLEVLAAAAAASAVSMCH